MHVCPQCRSQRESLLSACSSCDWNPIQDGELVNCLSTSDRKDADVASYIETYDTLGSRTPVESPVYVEGLAKHFLEIIGNLKGKDVCDVGSGRGYFIKHALAHGPRSVTAVDIASASLRVIAQRHPVQALQANAESLPFERHFDVVVATDILEHVLNTSNFLICANWALRDGGMLAIRVPYLEDMTSYSNYCGLPMHFTHLRTYDKAILVHCVETAGFKVERVHYAGMRPDYMASWLDRFPRVRERLRDWLQKKYGIHDAKAAPLSQWLMKPIEICAIARKVDHFVARDQHQELAKFHKARLENAERQPNSSAATAPR